jgi:hypothetical protein
MSALARLSCAASEAVVPFRWDVTRPEQLGRLVEGRPAESYAEFLDDLRACCARVVTAVGHLTAGAGGGDVLFVGRSPESLYDYLRGVCRDTGWAHRLRMLNVSLRWADEARLRTKYPVGLRSLRGYLEVLGLGPASLVARPTPAVLVDLVCDGSTFGNLVRMLRRACREHGVRWHVARRQLRLVGVTCQCIHPKGPYRWHLHGPGITCLGRRAARSVPVPWRFYDYIGNRQAKVAQSYPPEQWGQEQAGRPLRSADHAPALRQAISLYETGTTRAERVAFIGALARCGGLRLASLRQFASELRGG